MPETRSLPALVIALFSALALPMVGARVDAAAGRASAHDGPRDQNKTDPGSDELGDPGSGDADTDPDPGSGEPGSGEPGEPDPGSGEPEAGDPGSGEWGEELDLLKVEPLTGRPACDACDGSGTTTCFHCKGAGRLSVRCAECAGRRRVDCSADGCDRGLKTCRTCSGTGQLKSTVLSIQGGTITKFKTCGTCRGNGVVSCRDCSQGKSPCRTCNGGKKKFTERCEVCRGAKTTACKRCEGAGTIDPPPLDSRVVDGFRQVQSSVQKIAKAVTAAATEVNTHAQTYAAAITRLKDLEPQVEQLRTVGGSDLSQYLTRFRELVHRDYAQQVATHQKSTQLIDEIDTVRQKLADQLEFTRAAGREIERILASYDGRLDRQVREALPPFRRVVRNHSAAVDALELDVFRAGGTVRKAERDIEAIAESVERFNEKLALHREHVAEERRRRALEEQREPQDEAIRDAVRAVNLETGLPQIKIRNTSKELDETPVELKLEYLDSNSKPLHGEYHALDEDWLARIPAVVTTLFDQREEIVSISFRIRARVEVESATETVAHDYPIVQRFRFVRELWKQTPASATWRERLARSSPSPEFPAPEPGSGSLALIVLAIAAILLAAVGVTAIFISRRQSIDALLDDPNAFEGVPEEAQKDPLDLADLSDVPDIRDLSGRNT